MTQNRRKKAIFMLLMLTCTFIPLFPGSDVAEAERGALDIGVDAFRVFAGGVGVVLGIGEIVGGTASAFTVVGIPITVPAWVKGTAMIGGGALVSISSGKNLVDDVKNFLDDEDENTGPNDDEGGPNDDEGGPNDDEGGPNDDEGGPND